MPSWKLSLSGNRVRGKGDSVRGHARDQGHRARCYNGEPAGWRATRKGKGEQGMKAGGREEEERLVKRQEPARRQRAAPGRHEMQ